MLTFAYSQNDDPRWKAYRETRSGVCMALSTHYVICALTGADFVKWLDAPSGRERPGGRAPRVVIGAQRSGPVKNVRAIYDQHETFKRMIGGYRDMELRWLRNYIQGHARATTGQLSLGNGTAAIGPTQVPVELVKALKSGAAVYFAWTSSAAGAGHAVAAARNGDGFSFFEPNYGVHRYSGVAEFQRFGVDMANMFTSYGINSIDRIDWIAFG